MEHRGKARQPGKQGTFRACTAGGNRQKVSDDAVRRMDREAGKTFEMKENTMKEGFLYRTFSSCSFALKTGWRISKKRVIL